MLCRSLFKQRSADELTTDYWLYINNIGFRSIGRVPEQHKTVTLSRQ